MKLYVYDHCPYCVKARMIFGLKGLDFELVTLLNDDEKTPISMVGQKMVPILEKEDGSFMAESIDIVEYIDKNYAKQVLTGNSSYPKLEEWLGRIREYNYSLAMPRWVQAEVGEFLGEFATKSAKDYFRAKKQAYVGSFSEHLANSSQYILGVNNLLKELDVIIKSPKGVAGELSMSDIHLFAILHTLSIVKGLSYPERVNSYRLYMSDISDIPLHDKIAL